MLESEDGKVTGNGCSSMQQMKQADDLGYIFCLAGCITRNVNTVGRGAAFGGKF